MKGPCFLGKLIKIEATSKNKIKCFALWKILTLKVSFAWLCAFFSIDSKCTWRKFDISLFTILEVFSLVLICLLNKWETFLRNININGHQPDGEVISLLITLSRGDTHFLSNSGKCVYFLTGFLLNTKV